MHAASARTQCKNQPQATLGMALSFEPLSTIVTSHHESSLGDDDQPRTLLRSLEGHLLVGLRERSSEALRPRHLELEHACEPFCVRRQSELCVELLTFVLD